MINSNNKPSLDGMVFCANCGEKMVKSGDSYYCRNTTVESKGKCTVITVDASRLTYAVVTQMVDRPGNRRNRPEHHRTHHGRHRCQRPHPALKNGAGRGLNS